MKTISVLLFAVILSLAIRPDLRQSSLLAQEEDPYPYVPPPTLPYV